VVAAAFVLAVFGWGVGFYGPPVYLHAVRAARGWSLPLVSAAVTLHFLTGAIVVANLPALYRRLGLPSVTKAGVLSLALGGLRLGLGGTALAALRRYSLQRSRLGGNECRSHQRDRVAVVRPCPAGGAGHGL
jgi:uncharacterized membrane protein YdcZ (DUF606 family)